MKHSKDEEVLMAILNVKKYAKNLKKKVSNLQDPSDDQDVISSPSFFNTPQQYSPVLAPKSSYNSSFESLARKTKQQSMTILPAGKVEMESVKSSAMPVSPSKTFNFTNGKSFLSQSQKAEAPTTGLRSANNSSFKKQMKEQSQTLIHFDKKGSGRREKQSQLNLDSVLRQPRIPKSPIVLPEEPCLQNNQLVLELLLQINNLKNQICDHKKALIVLRSKYLEMEEKCRNKIESDHLLDVLKVQIQKLEADKRALSEVIENQNKKIVGFQLLVVDIAAKFMDKYKAETDRLAKLEAENLVYRQLLNLPTIKPVSTSERSEIPHHHNRTTTQNKLAPAIKDGKNRESESESQGEGYGKSLKLKEGKICKNEKDIQEKYAQGSG